MRHLGQKPGPPVGAASDHDPIGVAAAQCCLGFFQAGDIAVDDDGDFYGLFHLCHEIPIRYALIELLAGAAVYGHHRDAGVFGDFCQFWRIQAL